MGKTLLMLIIVTWAVDNCCARSDGAIKKVVPMFPFSLYSYDGDLKNSPNDEDGYEPDLSDPTHGKRNWMEYLSSHYPNIDMVIYSLGHRSDKYKMAKMLNAVRAARELGLKVYLSFSWYGYGETTEYQRNDRGETSLHKPALQDSVTRSLLRRHIAKSCSLYSPDSVWKLVGENLCHLYWRILGVRRSACVISRPTDQGSVLIWLSAGLSKH